MEPLSHSRIFESEKLRKGDEEHDDDDDKLLTMNYYSEILKTHLSERFVLPSSIRKSNLETHLIGDSSHDDDDIDSKDDDDDD